MHFLVRGTCAIFAPWRCWKKREDFPPPWHLALAQTSGRSPDRFSPFYPPVRRFAPLCREELFGSTSRGRPFASSTTARRSRGERVLHNACLGLSMNAWGVGGGGRRVTRPNTTTQDEPSGPLARPSAVAPGILSGLTGYPPQNCRPERSPCWRHRYAHHGQLGGLIKMPLRPSVGAWSE